MMIEKIKQYLFGSVFRAGASVLTFLTLGSYVAGLVRDMLFAHFLGASHLLDVYNAAFLIPDILLNIFVTAALTSAFVPIFVHLYSSGEDKEAEKVATTVLHVAPLTVLAISIPVFIFMPWLSHLVAPGFSLADSGLLVSMTRLLLLSPIIFAISNTLGNILISYEKFVGYGLSPIFYNLGIILGIPLVTFLGPIGLIVGTLLGALAHLTIRTMAVVKTSFRPRFPIQLNNPNFLKILKLMIPRLAGQPVEQITFFIFVNMASTLLVGSIAILNFARNFESVPVSIFGIAFSTAVFASLSKKAALGDRAGFIYHFNETAKALIIVTLLATVFYLIFGQFVVRTLLGGGRFGETDIVRTAKVLGIFALTIPAESFIHLLVRSFYALKDTWTPIFVSIPGLLLIVLIAKTFIPTMGLNALPLSYFMSSTLEALILFFLLKKKLRQI